MKGWKQSDLAKKLEVSATYISLLERDRRDPSWSFVGKLADTLGVPLPVLLLLASESEEQSQSLRSVLGHELLALVAGAEGMKWKKGTEHRG